MKLLDFIRQSGSSVPKFARNIGYSPQHLYNIINKRSGITKRFIVLIESATEGQVQEIDFIDKEVLREDLEKSIEKFKEEAEFHG